MNLSKPYSVRLPIELAEKYEEIARETGVSPSLILRGLLEDKNPTFKVREPKSTAEDRAKVIFHLNKNGNNLNQIAKVLNSLLKAGTFDEDEYRKYIQLLDKIDLKMELLMDNLF
jgi:predicted transcriptional regulator